MFLPVVLLGRRGGGAAAWTPASLAGLAPSLSVALQRSTGLLWQNTAKTIAATADGDPVRVATCPWTGQDYTAPSDAARPLLWDEGGGKWSLSFDGVDDYLARTSHPFGTGDVTLSVASRLRCGSATAMMCPWGFGRFDTTRGGSAAFASPSFGGGGAGRWSYATGGANNYNATSSVTVAYATLTVLKEVGVISAATTIRKDGVVATDNGSSSGSNLNLSAGYMTLGTYPSNASGGVGGDYFSGRMSGCIFCTPVLSGIDLASTESYLSAL